MKSFLYVGVISLIGLSCSRDKGVPNYNGYTEQVGKILVNKCATQGCHNDQSKKKAGGLSLISWNKLFEGSNENSVVIPFRPDLSILIHHVNAYSNMGMQMFPTMPLNRPPLSMDEVMNLSDWIGRGAPDINNQIKFSDNPYRRKIYVSNQGCDLVTIFDAQSKLIMRYVDVGNSAQTEAPHDLVVSPDNKNWYVSFYASGIFQKFRTSDDTKVAELDMSDLSWHAMDVSGDSKYAIISHWDVNGIVALVDLQNMGIVQKYRGAQLLIYPHGCAINGNGTLAYVTCLSGNFIYKLDLSDPMNPSIDQVPLQPGLIPNVDNSINPYEVDFSPDYSSYYVTCQATRDIRVFNTSNDSLIAVIPSTGIPQLMSFSKTTDYLFVSNMEDSSVTSTNSSVNIINYKTNKLIKTVYPGYQDRGIVVDDVNKVVYVANRNITAAGPTPHHSTSCGGRSGYITLIDMNTLELIPDWNVEVSVDPYSVAIRK